MKKARGSPGFALIETLASLVVIGMISLMIVEGVGMGQRVWDRLDQHEAGGEAVDAAQALLRDRLEQIYPEPDLQGSIPPNLDFAGLAQSVAFVANPPLAERPSGLRRYTLSVNGKSQLVLTSVSAVGRESVPPVTQILLDHVRSVDLAYFLAGGGPTSTGSWGREWGEQPQLPVAIRVQLTFEPQDPRHWPDLIVRPWATIDAACQYDPVYHVCRGRQ